MFDLCSFVRMFQISLRLTTLGSCSSSSSSIVFPLGKIFDRFLGKRLQSSLPASNYDYILDRSESNRLRNEIFDDEKKRQSQLIPRVEKIQVNVTNVKPYEDATLIMNKHLSTPYHCAQHFSQLITERSIIAAIDGKHLWDMHRPLTNDCNLQFRHFKDEDPTEVNRAFWRSCSFLLGMVSLCFLFSLLISIFFFLP